MFLELPGERRACARLRGGHPRAVGRIRFIVAVLSVLSLPLIWLGVPFVVAPAAIALGLRGEGRLAIAAITTGVLVLFLVTGAYVYSAVDKLAWAAVA